MFCESCNREVDKSMNFCIYCGSQINKDAVRVRLTQKSEIDRAIEEKRFDFIWKKIINEKNTYAEYRYTNFFEKVIESIKSSSDFDKCTEKVLFLANQGYLYPKYLYGQAMMWTYKEHGLLSGSKAFLGSEKKFSQGLNLVLSMAENGQASAQSHAGMIYAYGFHNQIINPAKAYKYLKSSADKLHPQSMYELAMCYYTGFLKVEKNEDLAKSYFEKAAYFGAEFDTADISKDLGLILESSDKGNGITSPLAEKYAGRFNFSKFKNSNKILSDAENINADAIFQEVAYGRKAASDKI